MIQSLLLLSAFMSPEKVFPYPVHTQKLSNGFTVMAVPTEHKGLVAYYTVVRTGSRNEVEPGKTGFAHFFEHMMFRGTDKYPSQKYNDVLKALGADSNAFTTDDWTCYHIVAASSSMETLFEIESDRFQNLKYEKPEFQKEARAVLGEYNKNASSPFMIMEEKLCDSAFTTHTYKHTTMGFLEDIKAMPEQFEYSRVFFDRWYRPENCILVVAGDVTPEKVFALGKKYYGNWTKPAVESVTIPTEPQQTEEKRVEIPWPNKTLPYVCMGYHVPGYDPKDKDGRALDVLSQLLFAESAPLYQDLVLDRQLVNMLQGGVDDHRDGTLFTIWSRIKEEEKIDEVMFTIESAIDRFATTPPSAEKLKDVKSHMRFSFLRRLNSPSAIAVTLASYLQLTADPKSIDQNYATLESLTPEDIQRVAQKYFAKTNRTVVTLKGAK